MATPNYQTPVEFGNGQEVPMPDSTYNPGGGFEILRNGDGRRLYTNDKNGVQVDGGPDFSVEIYDPMD